MKFSLECRSFLLIFAFSLGQVGELAETTSLLRMHSHKVIEGSNPSLSATWHLFHFHFFDFFANKPPQPPTYRKLTFTFLIFHTKHLQKLLVFIGKFIGKVKNFRIICITRTRIYLSYSLLEKGIFLRKTLAMSYPTMFYNNFVFKTSSILATYKYR